MSPFHKIRTVAKYEAIILRRSWFFRLFAIGALFIMTIMNIGIYSPIGDEDWELVSIPSSLPLLNLYILNIGQAVVVIFLSADFLKRDKKIDTNEVLYTRSMSNFEYIIGKTLGILKLFIGLDIIILLIGLTINIISKTMTVDWMSYIWYLLIICVPTIIFSLGFAFMLMSVIRNQAVTFLLLLGIAALDMFWLWHRSGFIFDYMAFGLPVFKSGVIGFDNVDLILNQRLFYFFLGMTFVIITILVFRRLTQSKLLTSLCYLFMFLFIAGAGISGYNTYSMYKSDINEKAMVIETNRQYENSDFVSLNDAEIELVHEGDRITAFAGLKFTNDNDEETGKYIFSLNPGLEVTEIVSGDKKLPFNKVNHIIEIIPYKPLGPGESDSLKVFYSGSINESFCYPDYIDNLKDHPYQVAMLNVNKRQTFLSNEYVLLIPESQWYPVPALNYYPSNPVRIKVDFTNYTLRVKPADGLKAVSQGIMSKKNGYYMFTPESPLTGLTLAIGDYRSDSLLVDTVKYITHYFPGHDYYKKDLSELKDTLPFLVEGIMKDLEINFSTEYPFSTLSLVEVPVQFYSLPRMSTQTRAEVQSSMVLMPEKLSTTRNSDFGKRFIRNKRRMERSNQVITDKELQVRLFNDFIRNTFISGENFRYRNGIAINEPTRYRLGPSFYYFRNNFYSTEYPVINSVFESHLQKVNIPDQDNFRSFMGGLSDMDRTNLMFRSASFRDILEMNPSVDTIRLIITLKGDYLFNLLRAKAGIREFNQWFRDFLNENRFRRTDIIDFNDAFTEKFGFDFYPYLDDWFNKKEQPGFIFTDLQANEILTGDRVRYRVTFLATNPESVSGLFNIAFRTGGQGEGGRRTEFMTGGAVYNITSQGRGMETNDISRIVFLGPGETKKITTILDTEPRAMLVNTLFAKNIPGEINLPIDEIKRSRTRYEESAGEELMNTSPQLSVPGEFIVDNEEDGFNTGIQRTVGLLKKILGIKNNRGDVYQQVRVWDRPGYWQPVVNSDYYGKYVLSAVYTGSSTGDMSVTWTTPVHEPGYYDIYCYIGKARERRITVRSGSNAPPPPQEERRRNNFYEDIHYKVYHSEGIDELTVDYENADGGWHNMGRYYISSDTARVELTNKSSGRLVIGDAVKWVKVR